MDAERTTHATAPHVEVGLEYEAELECRVCTLPRDAPVRLRPCGCVVCTACVPDPVVELPRVPRCRRGNC